jgi:hypothetical protein
MTICHWDSMDQSDDPTLLTLYEWHSSRLWVMPTLITETHLIKTQCEMLKLSIECTRFERNYSSCTGRNSENICSSSAGALDKRKPWWNSENHHVKLQKFTLPNIKKKERKKEKKKLHANILFMTLSTIVKLLSNEIERLKECL